MTKTAGPLMQAFQRVVHERNIPRVYFEELLAGMEMDVLGYGYRNEDELLQYAYRVAGVVGLMMCHVMGVRDGQALRHAAHLGIGMQLTNIARDVLEDWQRERLYLPDDLLRACGVGELRARLGSPLPTEAGPGVAKATGILLDRADRYYASGDAGVSSLSARCGLGVTAARLIYSDIGRVIRSRDCDPFAGRAVVSTPRKLWLAARALGNQLLALPRLWSRPAPRLPEACISDPRELYLPSETRA